MAGQAYKMKMAELREFCRIKNLDWGTRAKLIAYYEHLHPQQVIVDDTAIITDLPPSMRVELVTRIYGAIIVSVPLFFGLDSTILTELCLALMPVPAMKGEIIVKQGTKGTEMYCLVDGSARVTSKIASTDDEERVRVFIEEIFGANHEVIHLYEPGQEKMFSRVMRRAKQLALEKRARATATATGSGNMKHGEEQLKVSYRMLIEDEKLLSAVESAGAIVTARQSIKNALKIGKKHGCVKYSGLLRITAISPHGPSITIMPKETWPKIQWNSSLYLLCAALRDGVTLCRLLNLLLGNKKLLYTSSTGAVRTTVDLATNVTGAVVGLTSAVLMGATGKAAGVVPEALGGKGLQQGVAAANDKQTAAIGKVFDPLSSTDGVGNAIARRNVELFVEALEDPSQEFYTGELCDMFCIIVTV